MAEASVWLPVVSWSLYFWESVFSFRADSILKSDGDFISNWKFTDCVHFFGARARQAVIETIAVVYEHTKRTQEMCSPIGHNNTKHFLCPIRSRHPLEFLEIVRWESVPRGSSALTWKLSSRLFSRPDWLPLGLRGWDRPVPELPACRRLGHSWTLPWAVTLPRDTRPLSPRLRADNGSRENA